MYLLDQINTQLDALQNQNLRRSRRTTDTPCAPRVTVDGRAMLAFCSNDYLGLAAHPAVVLALQQGAQLYGAGSGAAHLVSGHSRAHAVLEHRLAEFVSAYVPDAKALYFCTGYMANLASITGLAALATASGQEAHIFSESMNHASLIDGARLARVGLSVYPHADVAALETMLKNSTAAIKIVATDSVFSMDGNIAPVPALLALCERHQAWLVVDDAHGFGVLGEQGRGVLEHFQLRSPYLIYMGTLGKAAGVGGAFVAAHTSVIEWLIQKARPYIYTTATPPALAHALLTSLDIIQSDEGAARRAQLRALIARLQQGLHAEASGFSPSLRWRLLPSSTAIQPLIIGENADAMRVAARLYVQGLWVPAIRPPTVPTGTARLRITLSAAHTEAEVDQLLGALSSLSMLSKFTEQEKI